MEPRTRLAWGGGVCLVLLLLMVITTPVDQLATHRVLGFVFKLTLMIGALWLAWPDVVRLGRHLPPKFVILASVSLFATLIQPRFGMLLIGLTLVYWVGWRVYKQAFPGGFSLKNRRD
jgi:hypothetical protein